MEFTEIAMDRVNIKGTSDGLIIYLGTGAWSKLIEELESHLSQKASFFKGGRVALKVGPRKLTRQQLESVGELLVRHHVSLWAVESESTDTQVIAAELGLEVGLPPRQVTDWTARPLPQSSSVVIQRTLRSGQVVTHPGHVVIIGDVNPGAEVRAGGSVIIWGRLRGVVHAGIGEEGEKAVVCALQFSPTQLRISSYITRAPTDDVGRSNISPEMAVVQNSQIVVEAWSGVKN